MPDPRAFTAHFGSAAYPGEIAALEGNRGQIRVRLENNPGAPGWPAANAQGELEMHDGARFRVGVLEVLDGEGGGQHFRLKLLGKGGGP
ncbi:hypothetical protein GCM10022631_23740 [Deinococcus rubellus]|uniref:hypothetical protein n=1 Tax=Deinococcus rubellus TaxID=1889240 RepID=UPI0031F0002E